MHHLYIQCAVGIIFRRHAAFLTQFQHLLCQVLYFFPNFCEFPDKPSPHQTRFAGCFCKKYRMKVLFESLCFRSIQIGFHIIPKTPTQPYVGVAIFEAREILTADPSALIPIHTRYSVSEYLGVFCNIVYYESLEFPRQHSGVSYRTTSGK